MTTVNLRPTRHVTMMDIARTIARRSTCARRQVGCVLTDAYGRVLSLGHNGVPRGHTHCTEHPCPGVGIASGGGLETCQAIHAEQNALLFCADITKIRACYVTASPCAHCVKMLLNTECRIVIYDESYAVTPWEWLDDAWVANLHYSQKDMIDAFMQSPRFLA